MYLKELTLQGFKTFAQKTTLRFLDPENGRHAITAIVGPNGSGKSNIADAVRWALGEQSLRLLRGKQAADVIFSGSDGKSRAGFAEIEMTFADVRGLEGIAFSEVTIARRLYRDGESDYRINGQTVRLADVQMLLAQANVGQRSYSVVGQGQIDHVLATSPEERKAFFDDATGVKPLQLKRHRAVLKLERTRENLTLAERLLQEIEPRLRTLKRLVRRLEQRETVEVRMHTAQIQYYGTLWNDLQMQLRSERTACDEARRAVEARSLLLEKERSALDRLESPSEDAAAMPKELTALQERYDALQEERARTREALFEAQKQLELARVKSTSSWTPLPLSQIIARLDEASHAGRTVKEKWRAETLAEQDIDRAISTIDGLLSRLQRPAPEANTIDPTLRQSVEQHQQEEARLVTELTALRQALHDHARQSGHERKELFAIQHRMLAAQDALHTLEGRLNEQRVAQARVETRLEDLERDMRETLGTREAQARAFGDSADTDALAQELQQLRHTLDMIGGIDEEIVEEFQETQSQYQTLEEQIGDLLGALRETEKLVTQLDGQIATQSARAFAQIQKHFSHYFKMLFGGGTCTLTEIRARDVERDDEGEDRRDEHSSGDQVVGVDIQATPPGKRLKSINLLSGGERAMTSIALICAIMATNPSPFVVLDEVDAALDEANTDRFVGILEELRGKTQFVVITHNRATMHIADVLYGVSMQQNGVSQMLSLQMEATPSTAK